MRFLFTTQPALSHLHPLVPLAQALQAKGHDVAFASAPRFCAVVEASGFLCFPAGLDCPVSGWEELFPRLREARAGRDPSFTVMRDIFAGATAQKMVPDLLRLCEAWTPDLIVRDPQEFGGCVAAECLGIPHATGRENRFLSPRQWQQFTEPALSDLRQAHGLPPDPAMAMPYRYLAFAWAPRSFIEACGTISPDVPFGTFVAPVMHFLRPVPFESSGDEALPEWIEQLPEQPTVYATLGTVFNQQPEVFQAIIEGLRDEAINLIVTVGRDQDPAQFGPQPPNVHVERYIPQSLLSPYCDLVITAGGFGTVMACLSSALPMVVVPLGADQPLNARRCEALGVGSAIGPGERTPEAIRNAAREVLAGESYRHEAERLRQQLQDLPGQERGVELLERLAQDRKPPD